MIQIQFPQAFCKIHNDYLMEIVRIDYLANECSRLCQICRKEAENNENIQEQRNNVEQLMQELNNTQLDPIEEVLRKKINEFCQNMNQRLFNEMQQLLVQFQQIRERINQTHNNYEELEQYIDNNKQKVIDKIIGVKHNVIDIIYDSIKKVDSTLFQENLYNQQIENARIPPIDHIIQNYDSYNLLLKFQVYLKRMSYFRQEDFERTCQLNATSFIDELDRQDQRLKKLENKLEDKIMEEANKLMMRFRSYKGFNKDNQEQVRKFIHKMQKQGALQIQEMNQNHLKACKNYENAVQYFRQLQSEQRQSFSRIAHLGRIDIDISLEEIQSCFEFNFIPIYSEQQTVVAPQMNFQPVINMPIQGIQVNINQHGQFNGEAQIQVTNGNGNGVFVNGDLVQNQIRYNLSQQLLQLDLSHITGNNENRFNFTRSENHQQIIYKSENEDENWTLVKNKSDGFWEFTIGKNKTIRDLRIINDQVNQNSEVVYIITDNFKKYNYTGTINNSFQYQGRGRLVLTERQKPVITKEGNWNNGKLEGYGNIHQNNEIFYEGNFIDGLRSGQGIEYFPQGYFYQGEFKDDKKHGSGVVKKILQTEGRLKDIEIEKCSWQNDEPIISSCQIF